MAKEGRLPAHLEWQAYWKKEEEALLESGVEPGSLSYVAFQELREKWNPTVEEILLVFREELNKIKKQVTSWRQDKDKVKTIFTNQVEALIVLSAITTLESQERIRFRRELVFTTLFMALQRLSTPNNEFGFLPLAFFHIFVRQSPENRVAITQGLQDMLEEMTADFDTE